MNSKRVYRSDTSGLRLTSFSIAVKESDLWIAVSSTDYHKSLPQQVEKILWNRRRQIENYLSADPNLGSSLEPCLPGADAPQIIRSMVHAGNRVGVGPMAAVAGAIAEEVGRYLLDFTHEVIVENGGDIFLKIEQPVNVGVYAGKSAFSGRLGLHIKPGQTPLGVCTSSGTVGPSFSKGTADSALALSVSTPLADAAATALGNMVKTPADFEAALAFAREVDGITGALLICGDKIAAWGEIELKKA